LSTLLLLYYIVDGPELWRPATRMVGRLQAMDFQKDHGIFKDNYFD